MELREATVNDLGQIYEVETAGFAGSGETDDHLTYPLFVLRQAIDALSDFFLVAESQEGDIAGHTLGALPSGSQSAWILNVVVHPSHRQKGLGRKLTVSLLERLLRRGAREVWLSVETDNRPAISLYEKLGFRHVDVVEEYFGPGEPRKRMRYLKEVNSDQ